MSSTALPPSTSAAPVVSDSISTSSLPPLPSLSSPSPSSSTPSSPSPTLSETLSETSTSPSSPTPSPSVATATHFLTAFVSPTGTESPTNTESIGIDNPQGQRSGPSNAGLIVGGLVAGLVGLALLLLALFAWRSRRRTNNKEPMFPVPVLKNTSKPNALRSPKSRATTESLARPFLSTAPTAYYRPDSELHNDSNATASRDGSALAQSIAPYAVYPQQNINPFVDNSNYTPPHIGAIYYPGPQVQDYPDPEYMQQPYQNSPITPLEFQSDKLSLDENQTLSLPQAAVNDGRFSFDSQHMSLIRPDEFDNNTNSRKSLYSVGSNEHVEALSHLDRQESR